MEFITAEEKKRLEERVALLKSRRSELSTRIGEARALGDLSENADYHAAREDQGLNEAEIRRIEERLKTARVREETDVPEDMVFVGSVVRLREVDSQDEDLYKIVGEASGNFDSDEIEVTGTSPMGEALMKARVGEVIRVELPRGSKRFEVVEIIR